VDELKSREEGVKSWTEGDFRLKLVNIQKYLGEMLQDSSLSTEKKAEITALYKQIYELFLSGMEMKKGIGK
jgi:hypothetical protein